jgi:hypothetical protein
MTSCPAYFAPRRLPPAPVPGGLLLLAAAALDRLDDVRLGLTLRRLHRREATAARAASDLRHGSHLPRAGGNHTLVISLAPRVNVATTEVQAGRQVLATLAPPATTTACCRPQNPCSGSGVAPGTPRRPPTVLRALRAMCVLRAAFPLLSSAVTALRGRPVCQIGVLVSVRPLRMTKGQAPPCMG